MRIAFAVVAAAAMSGCTGLPGLSTGRGQPPLPPRPAPPPAAIAINNPTATPTKPVRPRIHVVNPPGRPLGVWILMNPGPLLCPDREDPFWPADHPLKCLLTMSIRSIADEIAHEP